MPRHKAPIPDTQTDFQPIALDLDEGLGGQDFPERFNDFLCANSDPDRSYTVQVFEIVTNDKNQSAKQYVKSYTNSIPEFDEIADMGPGKYQIVLNYTLPGETKRRNTSATLSISPKYAQQKPNAQLPAIRQPEAIGNDNMLGHIVTMQNSFTSQLMQVMTFFMQTVGQLASDREKANGKASEYQNMGRIFNQMMMENIESQAAMAERIMETKYHIEPEREEEEAPTNLFDFIKTMFYKYGEQILTAAPQVQKFFRSQVNSSAEFQQLAQQPAIYKAACDDLIKENPENREKLQKVLSILGAPDPEALAAAMQEQATGQAG